MENEITIINTNEKERPSMDMDYKQVRQRIYQDGVGSKVTVIVLAYGKVEKTKVCVENILKYTTGVPFELWLLDNGSEENDTLEYFKSVEYESKKIIKITKNITGVFAMDKIIPTITSEYLAIIPNDVIVTINWLENLLACAESDPKIGVACPVSTNISNRQEEGLGGFTNLEEMQAKAAKFNKSDWRKWEERLRIIPSATLYRREIFDEAGVFDVGFIHDFGDDDYFFRVRRAGYKMMVCRDTFVHHNHYMQERDLEGVEIQRAQMGRKMFVKKYNGLDAWEDGANHIMEFSYYGDLKKKKGERLHILGVDIRCGTPVLDVKNKLRFEGYSDFFVDTFTTDLKYYIDLNSISNCVEHDHISNIISKYHNKKYNVIILGEALNIYQKPTKILLDLISLLDAGGILITYIHNTDNIYEFLWQQGLLKERETDGYQRISYEDVINALKETLLKKLDIKFRLCPVTDDIREFARQRAYPGLQMGREERVQNLYISEYWFWIQRA